MRPSDLGMSSQKFQPSGVNDVATTHSAVTSSSRGTASIFSISAATSAAPRRSTPSRTAPCRFAQHQNTTGSQPYRRRRSSAIVSVTSSSDSTCARRLHVVLAEATTNAVNRNFTRTGPGVSIQTIAHAEVTTSAEASVRSGRPPSA